MGLSVLELIWERGGQVFFVGYGLTRMNLVAEEGIGGEEWNSSVQRGRRYMLRNFALERK